VSRGAKTTKRGKGRGKKENFHNSISWGRGGGRRPFFATGIAPPLKDKGHKKGKEKKDSFSFQP